ncbi:RNA-binding (RRM/RBD/RNP motifs) family protein [Euphorbia peplus]|nr:RNA-binding (RRM/RBD/RNP motifs) family protein [Euphorbia peplus]
MPRGKGNASGAYESFEPENSIESDEKVDLDEDDDQEETMDEEVEYEEIEEIEEIEEEELVEVEEEEEEDNANNFDESRSHKSIIHDETNTMDEDEDERRIQAELLSRPPHGSEVYVGGIPLDASEEELRGFCECVGEVTEVRLMKGKDSNENKGFAFVTFRNVDLASHAIDKLNNTEFKGKRIKCSTSQAKQRLFLGNVPRSWKEEDLRKVVTEIGTGVTVVQLVKDVKTNNNRGFAFIDYYNNACAEYSRQKMMNPKFKLGDNAPTVSWADSKTGDSSAASSQVKTIYVKNLPKDVTQDQLKNIFEHHGKITKVVLPPAKVGQEKNRIGFIHFSERSYAMKALKDTEKYELDGQVLECSLAKPQTDQKTVGVSNLHKSGLLSGYPPGAGYGMVGGAFGTVGYGAAGFGQPMLYGRGPSPAGMAMMPMLLPDGRVGYVLQQPGVQPHTPPPSHHRNYSKNGSGSSNRSYGRDRGSRDRQQRSDESNGRSLLFQ